MDSNIRIIGSTLPIKSGEWWHSVVEWEVSTGKTKYQMPNYSAWFKLHKESVAMDDSCAEPENPLFEILGKHLDRSWRKYIESKEVLHD